MKFIEPHAHMVSRTTDDYQLMALAGCQAVCEPAFWAGYDRTSSSGFYDYFRQLTQYEPKRAAKFGIRHFSWLCINPKESENKSLASEVLDMLPSFLESENVLGIGEIGLNKNSRNELEILNAHIELAVKYNQLILIHTPHLEDKLKGTKLIIDALQNFSTLSPERVIIDHVEEHTIGRVLDAGFWAGMTLYPQSKCSLSRAADMVEIYGLRHIWMNSACDWGICDPLAVPKAALYMIKRGFSLQTVQQLVWDNPRDFLRQSGKFIVDD